MNEKYYFLGGSMDGQEVPEYMRRHGFYRDGEVWAQGSIDDVDTIDMDSSGAKSNKKHHATRIKLQRRKAKKAKQGK